MNDKKVNTAQQAGKSNRGFYILLTSCFLIIFLIGVLLARYSYTYNQKHQSPAAENVETEQPAIDPLPSTVPTLQPTAPAATPTAPAATPAAPAAAADETDVPEEDTPVLAPQRPVDGEIAVPYSADALVYSKTLEDWRTHNGIDIRADIGAHVKAAADGVVENVYNDNMMGMTVVLSHGGNLKTFYKNLSDAIPVKIGQEVKAGDVIGGVGETAIAEVAEVAHLHFEVTDSDQTVNPSDLIKN